MHKAAKKEIHWTSATFDFCFPMPPVNSTATMATTESVEYQYVPLRVCNLHNDEKGYIHGRPGKKWQETRKPWSVSCNF